MLAVVQFPGAVELAYHRFGILVTAPTNFMGDKGIRAVPDFIATCPGTLADVNILAIHKEALVKRTIRLDKPAGDEHGASADPINLALFRMIHVTH